MRGKGLRHQYSQCFDYGSNSIFQVKKKGTAVAKQKAEENDYFQQMEKVVFSYTLCQDRVQAGP